MWIFPFYSLNISVLTFVSSGKGPNPSGSLKGRALASPFPSILDPYSTFLSSLKFLSSLFPSLGMHPFLFCLLCVFYFSPEGWEKISFYSWSRPLCLSRCLAHRSSSLNTYLLNERKTKGTISAHRTNIYCYIAYFIVLKWPLYTHIFGVFKIQDVSYHWRYLTVTFCQMAFTPLLSRQALCKIAFSYGMMVQL